MAHFLRRASQRSFTSLPKQPLSCLQMRCASQGMRDRLKNNLEDIKSAGLYKEERIITSPQDAAITVRGGSKPVINFCANNYLGLSNNAALIEAAKEGLDSRGLGLSSVRFICGTQDIHLDLERKIAEFHEKDDCILF